MNYGKTLVFQTQPWGLFSRCGSRLLCSDGVVRAVELASTADSFFSVPAKTRVNGVWVSGYFTVEEDSTGRKANVFRHHTIHADKLPAWPARFTPEHDKLVGGVL